jgi:hypothetical protein
MKEIKAEDTKFIYFTKVDGYPKETEMGLSIQKRNPFMKEKIERDYRDIRAILTRWIDPHSAFINYLYWNDNSDLDNLDLKVEQGIFSDSDFAHSVKTSYQLTRCPSCASKWHTLILDLDAYFDAPGLAQKKLSEATIKLCPNCGAMLRQLVVKIWDKAE